MRYYLLPLFGLSLLLAGCNKTPSDAVIRRQIVGTWTFNQDGALTISPDGNWSIMESKLKATNSFAGTWQIKDDAFYMTTTNSRIPLGPSAVGGVQRYKIIHVDDQTLIYGDGQNVDDQITRKRIH
jgi:hypothetical protein